MKGICVLIMRSLKLKLTRIETTAAVCDWNDYKVDVFVARTFFIAGKVTMKQTVTFAPKDRHQVKSWINRSIESKKHAFSFKMP